jgi:hypothetical protein
MGTTLRAGALLGALLLVWSCGGKVFVDDAPAGSGGSGGKGSSSSGGSTSTSNSSTSASTTSSSGSGVTCDFACGGPIGLCGCEGPCSDGRRRAVGCGGAPNGGFSCTCQVDGRTVGMCDQPTLNCSLPGSCCEIVFGL